MSGRNECNENQNEQKTFHERSKWLGGQSIGLIVSVYLEVLDLFPSSLSAPHILDSGDYCTELAFLID